jgi:hypothetical protein
MDDQAGSVDTAGSAASDARPPAGPAKFQRDTSWEELTTAELPNGAKATKFAISSDPDDPDAPVVFRVEFPPNCVVAPHTHDTDYCEIILEGRQQVTRRWHEAGDIRIVQAHTAYGPLVAGEEGCTVLAIFRSGSWPAVPLAGGKDEGLHVDVLLKDLT